MVSSLAMTGSLISYLIGGWYLNHFSLGRSTWVANDSQKEATISESSPYLVLNLWKVSVFIKDLTQSNSSFIPYSLPSLISQSSELHLILSKRSHLNSIVFFIKEPVQEVSSMDQSSWESRALKFWMITSLGMSWLGHEYNIDLSLPQARAMLSPSRGQKLYI